MYEAKQGFKTTKRWDLCNSSTWTNSKQSPGVWRLST